MAACVYRDTTADVPEPERFQRRRFTRKTLMRELTGTFCFDIGQGFDCGTSYSLTIGEEFSLGATFGQPPATITFGFTHRVEEGINYTAPKCGSCSFIACRKDTTLREWRYETGIGWIRHTSIKRLMPSGKVSYRPQCGPDSTCSGCGQEPVLIEPARDLALVSAPSASYYETIGLEGRESLTTPLDDRLVTLGDEIVRNMAGLDEPESAPAEIAVVQHNGPPVVLGQGHPPAAAWLSAGSLDRARGEVAPLPDGQLPVIAVAHGFREGLSARAEAWVSDHERNDEASHDTVEYELNTWQVGDSPFAVVTGLIYFPVGYSRAPDEDRRVSGGVRLTLRHPTAERPLRLESAVMM